MKKTAKKIAKRVIIIKRIIITVRNFSRSKAIVNSDSRKIFITFFTKNLIKFGD
jgi:hypothetical protein